MPRLGPKPPPTTSAARRPDESALKKAVADGRVTDAEWQQQLGPQLGAEALESREMRAFLDVFVDGKVSFDKDAAAKAAALLGQHGYGVAADRSDKLTVQQIVEGNAAAHDSAFARLSEIVGDTSSRVPIAVVDGGFAAHPTLMDNATGDAPTMKARYGAALGKSFGTFTADARNEGAVHGTHVAGIATAGTSRIAASLHAVPLATAAEQTGAAPVDGAPADPPPAVTAPEQQPLYRAIDDAAVQGAKVVNVSIESFVTEAEAGPYRALFERHPDTLFVFGAGNDQFELGSAPGDMQSLVESMKLENVAVVGASYPNGSRWGRSNYGNAFVDLAARGHYISSADSDGDGFRIESGTSMASPNVANLAAKCLLLDPSLTPAQTIALLAATSDEHHSWKDGAASGGTVNPVLAMGAAAARRLIDGGASLDDAARQLGLGIDDTARVRTALSHLHD